MTAVHSPYQIAVPSIDAPVRAVFAFVGRSLEAVSYGWRFAEACCRMSGCRDDAAPTSRLPETLLERANAETSVH